MLEILEKHKKIKIFDDKIMMSAMICHNDFKDIKDKHNHKRYFKNDHILITSVTKLHPGHKSNDQEAIRIGEAIIFVSVRRMLLNKLPRLLISLPTIWLRLIVLYSI